MMSKASEYKKADIIWDIKYFISSYFFGYPKEVSLYFKSLFSKKTAPKSKFVILSTGRTGSTLLTSLLNSNPEVFCDGEILKHRFLSPRKVLNVRSKLPNKGIYGFKLMTHHIKDIQLEAMRDSKQFLKDLIADGYKIIYLERNHRLNQSLSMMYAILRNDWHKKKGAKKRTTKKEMFVDLEALDKWMNGFEEINVYEKRTLEGIPHVKVTYEDDLADPSKHALTMHRICDFLNIEYTAPKTNLRKITPLKYNQFILNADEMIAHLSNTKYAQYIEDQITISDEEVEALRSIAE